MNEKTIVLTLIVATWLSACGGGGSSSQTPDPPTVVAPAGLSYQSPQVFVVGTAITPLGPTLNGVATSFSVTPALPSGLQLNSGTGQISGTPTAATPQASYVIVASNSAGNTSFDLVVTVSAASTPVFTVGGSVSGLTGSGLVLSNSGGDHITISTNGQFSFPGALATGAAYAVSVETQPTGQNCSVAQGNGTVAAADVTNVAVSCETPATTYTIGGTVTGLTGTGLVLRNNGVDDLNIAVNGSFTFSTPLASGSAFAVAIAAHPTNPDQDCLASSASGVIGTSNVTNVSIACFARPITIGGTTIGLTGSGLRLSNGLEEIAVGTNGSFSFSNRYSAGIAYRVHVTQAPGNPAQTCAIANGTGTTGNSNISNIGVICANTPPQGRFLYVPNYFGDSISAYVIGQDTGSLTPVAGSPFSASTGPFQLVAHPNMRFLYLRSEGSTSIDAFAIDQDTGALTPVPGSPFGGGAGAWDMVMDRAGRFLFVPNTAGQSISAYTIDETTGVLTPVVGSPFGIGFTPGIPALTLDSGFLYVPDPTSNQLAGYSVNEISGALMSISGSPFQTTEAVNGVTIDALGRYLYGSTAQGSVYGARIDASTGALTSVGGPRVATLASPGSATIDPLGRFLYVSITDGMTAGAISGFAIDQTTGRLTPAGPVPTVGVGLGILQDGLAIRMDTRFLFASALGTDEVHVLEIDSTSGQLYSSPGSPFATGAGPNPITIDPAGRWIYVTNAAANTVSVYSTNLVTGALTPVAGSPFATGSGPIGQVIVN
jgi:6-phosphogluconolactonase (cycloisomerase 2 family)